MICAKATGSASTAKCTSKPASSVADTLINRGSTGGVHLVYACTRQSYSRHRMDKSGAHA